MLNFDRSAVKHGTQNIQNDHTSGFRTALECTKFVFGWGLPRTPLGELTTVADLRGPTSKGRGSGERGERERRRGEELNGRDRLPFRKFLDLPVSIGSFG